MIYACTLIKQYVMHTRSVIPYYLHVFMNKNKEKHTRNILILITPRPPLTRKQLSIERGPLQ